MKSIKKTSLIIALIIAAMIVLVAPFLKHFGENAPRFIILLLTGSSVIFAQNYILKINRDNHRYRRLGDLEEEAVFKLVTPPTGVTEDGVNKLIFIICWENKIYPVKLKMSLLPNDFEMGKEYKRQGSIIVSASDKK